MSDLISRQAAIDAVDEALTRVFVEHRDVAEKVINKIPSAQPEVLACGEGELIAQPETHEKRTETHACDLIDRRTLMKEFSDFVRASNNSDFAQTPTWNDAVSLVESMPSAQPERKTGRWIIKDNPGTGWYRITCSECGEDVTSTAPCIGFYPNAKVMWNYCPDCGARMEGEG